ncbi:MAG: hypothetical protein JWO91_1991 [Acidobacteriaceae bacterium]|nr:hypothetical protein [Acidobacteriaceae bacterium]
MSITPRNTLSRVTKQTMSEGTENPRVSTRTASEILRRRQEDPPPSVSISSNPILVMDPLEVFVNPRPLLRRIQNRLYEASAQGTGSGGLSDIVEVTPDWWAPAVEIAYVEIAYKEGNVVLSAELPGLAIEASRLKSFGDTLVIQGERRPERGPETRVAALSAAMVTFIGRLSSPMEQIQPNRTLNW